MPRGHEDKDRSEAEPKKTPHKADAGRDAVKKPALRPAQHGPPRSRGDKRKGGPRDPSGAAARRRG